MVEYVGVAGGTAGGSASGEQELVDSLMANAPYIGGFVVVLAVGFFFFSRR